MITISPNPSFADESVEIRISKLQKGQNVTLLSSQLNETEKEFYSFAFYAANEDGLVDLSTDPSLGGLYRGVKPTGLFWAMRENGYSALIKKKDAMIADEVTISVFDGHQNVGTDLSRIRLLDALASTKVQRLYLDPEIDRISVDSGDVRGVLFRPRGKKEIPGVIDIWGLFGGVAEGRAALLARKGFAVLNLSLYGLPGQPAYLPVIDLGVIERGVEFLQSQPGVLKTGVGMVGMSYGGTLVLAASSCIPNISCVVNVTGPVFSLNLTDFKYKNKIWKPVIPNAERVKIKNGLRRVKECYKIPSLCEIGKHIPDFHKSTASILFQYAEDDELLNLDGNIAAARAMFQSSGKLNYKIKVYPGAGHVILTPNTPLLSAAFIRSNHTHPTAMGGTPEKHERAQEEAWKDLISFLKQNLYSPLSSRL